MITYYNNYCKKYQIKHQIILDIDFPKDKLVKIFKPYLLLYLTSKYAFVTFIKQYNFILFTRSMHLFYKFNPRFGRKIVKIQYKTGINFKRKICGKLIEFNDKHIKFSDTQNQNPKFLFDHLECTNYIYEGVIDYYELNNHENNSINDEDDRNEDDDEEDDGYDNATYSNNSYSDSEDEIPINNTDHYETYNDEDSVS
jgi:hypothetical protein